MKKWICASVATLMAGMAYADAPMTTPNVAIDDLIKLADQSPEDANIRLRLASVLRMSGQNELADQYTRQARALGATVNEGAVALDPSIRGMSPGQDVWVCTMPGVANWGFDSGTYAYSIATTSANMGDQILNWQPSPSNQHPVIGQNLYQWYQGLFRHVGQSWLKHGFCALQQGGCGSCQPAGGGCPPRLGPGCSDPYSAGLNGSQGGLGAKHEVNPTTGFFPGNFTRPSGTNLNRGRLLVPQDLAIPTTSGAQYWVEGQYIHPEDSHTSSDHSLNNASHASVTMSSNTTRSLSFPTNTQQQLPAIFSWQIVDPSVMLQLIEADGYVYAGGSATDLGGGQWLYQYNIFNLDSNNGVDQMTVNFGSGVNVSNQTFHHPLWHSGSFYNNDPWNGSATSDGFVWTVADTGVNNNRVRWGTMYSFTFEADSEPETGVVTLRVPGSGEFDIQLPVPISSSCAGDIDGDGAVGSGDLGAILAAWGAAGGVADLDGDGTVGSGDLGVVLAGWGPC